MMYKRVNILLLLFLFIGCGSTQSVIHSERLNTLSVPMSQFQRSMSNIIFGFHEFEVREYHRETPPIRLESHWRTNRITADDIENGFTSTRTRISVRAHPRNSGARSASRTDKVGNIRLTVYFEVRDREGDYKPYPLYGVHKNEVKKIVRDLEQEFTRSMTFF